MFTIDNLYNMIKPEDNLNRVTNYELIIGSTASYGDEAEGLIVINALNTKIQGSPVKRLVNNRWCTQSIVQIDFQIDFYVGSSKDPIANQFEANKVQEYLKGPEVRNYLKALDASILPSYSEISFENYMNEKKELINRSRFEFSIVSFVEINYETDIIKNLKTEGGYL